MSLKGINSTEDIHIEYAEDIYEPYTVIIIGLRIVNQIRPNTNRPALELFDMFLGIISGLLIAAGCGGGLPLLTLML